MGEVAKREVLPAQANESTAVLSMIERVACDPNVDISKLEKMLDLQERILNRNAKQAYMADLALMQSQLPRVAEKGKSNNGKYALLEDINDAVRPALQQYGFAVSFRIDQKSEKLMTVTGILAHKQGHSEETSMILPIDTSGSKNPTQSIGSTVSYGKRYVICALLNISTGDDTNGGAPQGKESLSDAQLQNLGAALKAAGMTEEQFCAHPKINIASLADFQPQRLSGALKWLQSVAQGAKP